MTRTIDDTELQKAIDLIQFWTDMEIDEYVDQDHDDPELKARLEAMRLILTSTTKLAERMKVLERACSTQNDEICQTLGKALGYPRYCDYQKNFPGATEADGVCVGEHVAETLAESAANRIAVLEGQRDRLVDGIKLALRHVPHTAECCVVRPTEQWDGNGSVSFEGCNCDRRKLESILTQCTEGQAG